MPTSKTTRVTKTTGRKPANVPAPKTPHYTPASYIPLPYQHPIRTANTSVDQQINASLGALPTQETVAAPYLRQQDSLGQLSESLLSHLQQAAAYRSDLARGIAQLTQTQGQQAAQSVGGASPEGAAAASGDASTLGGYGTNAAAAVTAEMGSVPGWTSQYQSKISLAMQQELDKLINGPRQQILAQRPSLYQTLLDRFTAANSQIEAQNQSAQVQNANLALNAGTLGVQQYNAQVGAQGTPDQTTTTTDVTQTPDAPAGAAGVTPAENRQNVAVLYRQIKSWADTLYAKGSQTGVAPKNGYYLTYRYYDIDNSSFVPKRVLRTGKVFVDQTTATAIQGNPSLAQKRANLPPGAVMVGSLQPVTAGSNITTYTGHSYAGAVSNLKNSIYWLNQRLDLGLTPQQIQDYAVNAINARWLPGERNDPNAAPPARGGNAAPPHGPKPAQGSRP